MTNINPFFLPMRNSNFQSKYIERLPKLGSRLFIIEALHNQTLQNL